MNILILSSLLFLIIPAFSGCDNGDDSEKDDNDGDNGNGSDADADVDAGGDECEGLVTNTDEEENTLVILNDDANYAFQSSLSIETTPVKSLTDLVFDWSEVTEDMRGHDLDPFTGVDMMEIVLWNLPSDEVLARMTEDDLDLADLVGMLFVKTENELDTANYFDVITPSGSTLPEEDLLEYVDTDLYPPEDYTYTLMLAEGEVFGQGTLLIEFFRPDPEESNTVVKMTNDSTVLDFTVDLMSQDRIVLPSGTSDIVFDWSDDEALVNNALGNDFVPTKITDVMIGHYRDLTPEDLEDVFLDIELIADDIYRKFMSAGTSVKMSELENSDGETLAGFDGEGTWIIALMCGSCSSPAPWFLGIIETCEQ